MEWKCLALGTDMTICSHQESKHTLLYLWFLKDVLCQKHSLSQKRGSWSHTSCLCEEFPNYCHFYRSMVSTQYWLRRCSISTAKIKLFLSAAPSHHNAPGSGQPWASQRASVLCLLYNQPKKINALDNRLIILLSTLLPLTPVSSVNIFWQLYILAIGGAASHICSLEGMESASPVPKVGYVYFNG